MRLPPLTLLAVIVSMVAGVACGVLGHQLGLGRGTDAEPLRLMAQTLRSVKALYVESVADEQLIEDALRGMVRGLDRHSRFLDEAALAGLQADLDGAFGGIGVRLALVDGHFTLVSVTDGLPAAEGGLLPGDRITAIDRKSLQDRRLSDVVGRLRGAAGEPVRLSLWRQGEGFDADLVRVRIAPPSVASNWLEPGYAHVRIRHFNKATEEDFVKAIGALAGEQAVAGLVLDLRGNTGGMFPAAVAVAGALLDGGAVAYTEGRAPPGRQEHLAPPGDLLNGAPAAVLIDRQSASASEIVAAALQQRGRALLLGERSYGKGTVQSVVHLRGTRGLKLTTAHYFTANGSAIQERGIEPDVAADAEDSEAILAEALALLKGAGPDGAPGPSRQAVPGPRGS